MSVRAAALGATGLLGASVALCVGGTVLSLRVADVVLPAGSAPSGSPAFLWSMLVFPSVGVVVALRRPGNPLGWLLLGIGLLWQASHLSGDLRAVDSIASGDLVPRIGAWGQDVLWIPAFSALPLLLLLFPTGHLPSRRWRAAPALLGAGAALLVAGVGLRPGPLTSTTIANPLGVVALAGWAGRLEGAGNVMVAAASFAALASLFVRHRSADHTAREQLRWLLLATVVVIASLSAANVLESFGAGPGLLGALRVVPLFLVPMAIGVALLRHRLLDIDLVISRLVVYVLLAAGVVGLYVAVVVGVGGRIGRGEEPSVPLAVLATAAVAVVFDPARRWLQHLANRLVYGARASPYDALASMTRRVGAGFADHTVLDRIARAIADATGGVGEVWISGGDHLLLAGAANAGAAVGADPRSAPALGALGSSTPLTDPPLIEGRDATFLVRSDRRILGALAVTKGRGDILHAAEERLLADLADSAAVVLDNARLVTELRSSRQRLVAAQDDERRRVERDLHDGAQQRLLELALTLRRVERNLANDGGCGAAAILTDAHDQLLQALAELRNLARGIHPAILTEQGLAAAIESLADRSTIDVTLDLDVPCRLVPPIESTAYFVATEALTNVAKHAPGSSAALSARISGPTLVLEVTDDGPGGADPVGHGLRGLTDRVEAIGGHLEVRSAASGGTIVQAVLPCE